MLIRTLLMAFGSILAWGSAQAQQNYPSRPIHIIVGFQPGSSSDGAARAVGQKLGEIINGSVVIENRPGASGDIAARYVASSVPDGYTLFLVSVANSINVTAKGQSAVDISRDLMALAQIGETPNVLVVTPSLPAKSVADVIALAKAKPGELTYASAGAGSGLHMAAELFSARANIQMLHIPYSGSSAAMSDLLTGRTSIMFAPSSITVSFVKQNSLRAIATTGVNRSTAMPDLPTVAEEGLPGFESSVWFGVMGPNGLPPEIAKKLEEGILTASRSPAVKAQFDVQGVEVVQRNQAEFAEYIHAENAKWGAVIKDRNLKLN